MSKAAFIAGALVLAAVMTFAVIEARGDAKPVDAKPVDAAACRTMDGMFRPHGINGKEQLLRHLIESSDRLAAQTGGDLQRAAEVHASYARLLYAEAQGDPTPIPERTQREGLAAYDSIRAHARKLCSLRYLDPRPG